MNLADRGRAGIDSAGVRLYKTRFHFGPGAAKARRAFSFARPSQHERAVLPV